MSAAYPPQCMHTRARARANPPQHPHPSATWHGTALLSSLRSAATHVCQGACSGLAAARWGPLLRHRRRRPPHSPPKIWHTTVGGGGGGSTPNSRVIVFAVTATAPPPCAWLFFFCCSRRGGRAPQQKNQTTAQICAPVSVARLHPLFTCTDQICVLFFGRRAAPVGGERRR